MIVIYVILVFIVLGVAKNYIDKKRCEKAHNYVDREYVIRKRSNEYRVVCEDFKATIPTCKRCYHKLEPKIKESIAWYNSVSMPSDYWKEIDDKGYKILDS